VTTLAAVQGQGWCSLGADTQASDDSGFTMEIVTGKIFHSGPVIIAGAGAVRGINILQFAWTAPKFSGKSTDHYVTKTLIPAIRKVFIESGYDMKADVDTASNDNEFIIAVHGVIYAIGGDYSWERCTRGIYVSGSGGKYALGALAALKADKVKSPEAAESMLIKAIAIAIRWDAYSGGLPSTLTQHSPY
jgi:ATP-dependent protease HslVU (ClpYQ) peptidase subunit